MKSTLRELKSSLLLYSVILLFIIAGFIAFQEYDENEALKKQIQLLEGSIEQQQENNRAQIDSLQQSVEFREKVNLKLKDSLLLLQNKRKHLNQKADENKTGIANIRDVDSLRNAVARHYR